MKPTHPTGPSGGAQVRMTGLGKLTNPSTSISRASGGKSTGRAALPVAGGRDAGPAGTGGTGISNPNVGGAPPPGHSETGVPVGTDMGGGSLSGLAMAQPQGRTGTGGRAGMIQAMGHSGSPRGADGRGDAAVSHILGLSASGTAARRGQKPFSGTEGGVTGV